MYRLRSGTLIFTLLIWLIACKSNPNFGKITKNCEYVEVIRRDITNGEYLGSILVEDKKEIHELLGMIEKHDAPGFDCKNDFIIKCMKEDSIIFMAEMCTDGLCQAAVFKFKDEIYHRYITDEGVKLLLDLSLKME